MFRGSAAPPPSDKTLGGPLGLATVGGGIGFLSGLLGAGGAFLSVPYMTRRGVPIHGAVATSAAIGFPVALANVAGYLVAGQAIDNTVPGAWGYLYLPALLCIVVCSVLTAPLGARAAHAMNVKALKRVFAVVLALLAAYMLVKIVA